MSFGTASNARNGVMPRLCRFFWGIVFLMAGTGIFPQTVLQTVRQNEAASFTMIQAGLGERNIAYTERDLLAEYGVFGKSLFTGNAAGQEAPFLFVFPVYDCHTELAFSLLDMVPDAAADAAPDAAGNDEAAPNTAPAPNVVFLGDVFSASNAAFNDLLESLDYPENALLMYMSRTEEGALALTFFQGLVKNPFHLTGTFARYLEARSVPFSFLEKTVAGGTITGKTIVIAPDIFPGTNTLAACLLGFAATNPPPETDPDTHYITADVRGRKLILSNLSILRIVLAGSAAFLSVALFFTVLFNKKRAFVIALTVFCAFAAVLLLNNPLRTSRNDDDSAYILVGIPGAIPPAMPQDNGPAPTEPAVEVKKTVFLDRITYTIRAEYPREPYRIAVFYDYEAGEDGLPGEVYEAPFPYEVEDGRVTFILGEYPPNPLEIGIGLEAGISFPRTLPGTLSITAFFGTDDPAPSVWSEGEPSSRQKARETAETQSALY